MINRTGWRKRQQQKNVLVKHLAPSFLEEINVVWIKCLLQAFKETYIAVKYGFTFYPCADLRAVPAIPCRKAPFTGARLEVPSSCPVLGPAAGSQTLVPAGEQKAPLWRSRAAGVEKKNENPQ